MPSHPHPACSCLGHALSSGACGLRPPTLAFRMPVRTTHMLDSATPRWADRLFSPYRGNSAWTRGTEHFLSSPWACSPMGITEPDTASLTHETNTCKLFKNISIKLPGWLRAAPIHSARAPSSPQPPFCYGYGRFLRRPKSLLEVSAAFSQEESVSGTGFQAGSRLPRRVGHGLALGGALSRQSEETLEGDDLRTCRLQARDERHGLWFA